MGTRVDDHDLVVRWIGRIADAVTPEETVVAGEVAARFLAAGGARRTLLRPAGGGAGAAGGDTVFALAQVLEAIVAAAGYLKAALASAAVGNTIGLAGIALAYRTYRDSRAAPRSTVDPLAEATIRAALDSLRGELERTGAGRDAARSRAAITVEIMLESPEQAARFVEMLSRGPASGGPVSGGSVSGGPGAGGPGAGDAAEGGSGPASLPPSGPGSGALDSERAGAEGSVPGVTAARLDPRDVRG